MKIKVSISMEDELFEQVKQHTDNSNGNFRNKSHLIEMAVKKFLDEKINENKEINEGGKLT
jgi:metal-responsive CopG/Arc/MetJ family transcriptional regulator